MVEKKKRHGQTKFTNNENRKLKNNTNHKPKPGMYLGTLEG